MAETNWIATVGHAGLLLSLVVSAYAVAASVAGARRGSRKLEYSGIYAAYGATALITFASAIMFFLIMANDFTVKYVAHHSDASMPWYYKITAFWGGLDGSIMFWVLLLALFSSVAIFLNRERHRELIPYVTAVLFTVVGFFLFLIIFEKRPFDVFLADAPHMGKGLNPLLQNPYMATHPPSLYLGFVSATVPFAFGMAALITGNLDDSWLASTRRWAIISWYFLAQGLVLGSLWAYEELGWGGYWGWDPVENAGFLPWLTSTAFLHSIMIQERRGMLKVWNVCLVIITFLLTIVGTFMTRSGIVQSVHAFGQDTELAWIFGGFIFVVAVFAFGFVIYRLPLLRSRNELDSWISREFAFLVNNWILLSAAFFVLTATLFPTISEAITGERITVGPPFFTKWMTPIGLTLLFLTGVGPLIAWRKASTENLRQQFLNPFIGMVLTIGALQFVPGLRGWMRWSFGTAHPFTFGIPLTASVLCFGLCTFVFVTITQEVYRGTRVRQTHTKLDFFTSLIGLVARGKRRYGGYLVHVAVVLMFIGFAGDAYKKESEATLERGKSAQLDRYSVRFDGLSHTSDSEKEMITANLTVFADGKEFAKMAPGKWIFRHHEDEPTTEVDIKKMVRGDLYLILNGYDGEMANIKIVINPLINWIWMGFLLLVLGTAIAFMPDRAYQLAASAARSDKGASAGAVATLLLFFLFSSVARAQDAPQMEQAHMTDLHSARSSDERALFQKLKCLCGCPHNLDECGSECGPGVKRRLEVQKMLDAGKSQQDIIDWSVGSYGQQVLLMPLDKGINRIAWGLPYAAIFGAVGMLAFVGRKWTRKPPAPASRTPERANPSDGEYEAKLEDELDKLD